MRVLDQLHQHLKDMKVDWHLCGGFAIDVYLGKETRAHKDLDITVSFDDMEECIDYLKSKGWTVVAPVGAGRFVPVELALKNSKMVFDNIWCYKEEAEFIKTVKVDGQFQYLQMINRIQNDLDFIEVLFNRVENGNLYYLKNPKIYRKVNKAFLKINNISILSPEIILLYKSRNPENDDYKQDFQLAINKLCEERKNWLVASMKIEYPRGHPWL